MAFPKGILKLIGVGCTITNPNGPTTTVTVTGGVAPATTVTGPDAFGAAPVVGTGTHYARNDHDHGLPASPLGLPLGLTGAVAATRYVGATASGAPASGTFAVGDFVIDQTGKVWVCTVAGTPGTWVQVGGGGGLPAWFQSGSGGPLSVVTPNTEGGLYFDTTPTGGTGLWTAIGVTSADWRSLGGAGSGGLVFDPTAGTALTSNDESNQLVLPDGGGLELAQSSGAGVVFVNAGNPNGHIAALDIGDICIDTSTPGVWQATAADNSHWIQFGGTLPTSSAGLVTGSFYTTANVVHVA